MITDQQRLILMIKTSHATKVGSHASKEDPQKNKQRFDLHNWRNWSDEKEELTKKIIQTVCDIWRWKLLKKS